MPAIHLTIIILEAREFVLGICQGQDKTRLLNAVPTRHRLLPYLIWLYGHRNGAGTGWAVSGWIKSGI